MREFFEPRLGVDLGAVRVHRDGEAQALSDSFGARAFAVEGHVAFNAGEYDPQTAGGQELLAHELAHVVQQGAAQPLPSTEETPQSGTAEAATADPSGQNSAEAAAADPSGESGEASSGGGSGENDPEAAKPIPPRTQAALEKKFNVDLTGATVVGDISRLRSPADLAPLTLNVRGASFKGSDYDLSTAAGQEQLASDIRAGQPSGGGEAADPAATSEAEATPAEGQTPEQPAAPTSTPEAAASTPTAPGAAAGQTPATPTGTLGAAAGQSSTANPLPPQVRGVLEQRFGVNLNGAMVTGDITAIRSPQDLANLTLTLNGVTFRGSDYNLNTEAGRQQLAQDLRNGGPTAQGATGQASAPALPTPPPATPTPGSPQDMVHQLPTEAERFAAREAATGQTTGAVDPTTSAETYKANMEALVSGQVNPRDQVVTAQVAERATIWEEVATSDDRPAAFKAALVATQDPVMAASPLGLPTLTELGLDNTPPQPLQPTEVVADPTATPNQPATPTKETGATSGKEVIVDTPKAEAVNQVDKAEAVNEGETYQQQAQQHVQVLTEHQQAHETVLAQAAAATPAPTGTSGATPAGATGTPAAPAPTGTAAAAPGGAAPTAQGQTPPAEEPLQQTSGVGTDPGPRPQMNQLRTTTPTDLGQQRSMVDSQVGAQVAATDALLSADLGQYKIYPLAAEGTVNLSETTTDQKAQMAEIDTWLEVEGQKKTNSDKTSDKATDKDSDDDAAETETSTEQETEMVSEADEEDMVDTGGELVEEAEQQSEAAVDHARRTEAQRAETIELQRQEQSLRTQEQQLKRQRQQKQAEQAALGQANSQDPSTAMKQQQLAQGQAALAQKEQQLQQSQARYQTQLAQNREVELDLLAEQTAQNKEAKELEAKKFAHEVELAQVGVETEEAAPAEGGGKKKGAGGEGADAKADGPKGPRAELTAAETAQQEEIDKILNCATAQGIRMTQAEAEAQYQQTQAAQTQQAQQAEQAQLDSAGILANAATENANILGQFATLAASIQAEAQTAIQTLITTAETQAKTTLDKAQQEAEAKKTAAEAEAKSVVDQAKAEAAKMEDPGNIVAEAEAKAQQIIAAMEAAVKQIIATAQATARQILATAQQNVATETQTAATNTAAAGQAANTESTAVATQATEQVNQTVANSQANVLQNANVPEPNLTPGAPSCPPPPPMPEAATPAEPTATTEPTATPPTQVSPTTSGVLTEQNATLEQLNQQTAEAQTQAQQTLAPTPTQATPPATQTATVPAPDPMAQFNQLPMTATPTPAVDPMRQFNQRPVAPGQTPAADPMAQFNQQPVATSPNAVTQFQQQVISQVPVTSVGSEFTQTAQNLFVQGMGDQQAIAASDINQGTLNDCHLMASMATVAQQNPQIIQQMIKPNPTGGLDVTLYQRNPITNQLEPQVVNVSADNFPVGADGNMLGAQPGDVGANGGGEIWAQVVEKAYAQMNGGYQTLGAGGLPADALSAITGQESQVLDPKSLSAEELNVYLASGQGMTITTFGAGSAEAAGGPLNAWHSYSVTSVDPRTGMVTLNNPAGPEAPPVTMSLADFQKSVANVTVNPLTAGNTVSGVEATEATALTAGDGSSINQPQVGGPPILYTRTGTETIRYTQPIDTTQVAAVSDPVEQAKLTVNNYMGKVDPAFSPVMRANLALSKMSAEVPGFRDLPIAEQAGAIFDSIGYMDVTTVSKDGKRVTNISPADKRQVIVSTALSFMEQIRTDTKLTPEEKFKAISQIATQARTEDLRQAITQDLNARGIQSNVGGQHGANPDGANPESFFSKNKIAEYNLPILKEHGIIDDKAKLSTDKILELSEQLPVGERQKYTYGTEHLHLDKMELPELEQLQGVLHKLPGDPTQPGGINVQDVIGHIGTLQQYTGHTNAEMSTMMRELYYDSLLDPFINEAPGVNYQNALTLPDKAVEPKPVDPLVSLGNWLFGSSSETPEVSQSQANLAMAVLTMTKPTLSNPQVPLLEVMDPNLPTANKAASFDHVIAGLDAHYNPAWLPQNKGRWTEPIKWPEGENPSSPWLDPTPLGIMGMNLPDGNPLERINSLYETTWRGDLVASAAKGIAIYEKFNLEDEFAPDRTDIEAIQALKEKEGGSDLMFNLAMHKGYELDTGQADAEGDIQAGAVVNHLEQSEAGLMAAPDTVNLATLLTSAYDPQGPLYQAL